MGQDTINETQADPEQGPTQRKGDLYNPNECWRCGGLGHFARDCKNDVLATKAIGKLHHTLEAETPITKTMFNEFLNKLMRAQRKGEIVRAKLTKARQQEGSSSSTEPPATPTPATPGKKSLVGGSPAVTKQEGTKLQVLPHQSLHQSKIHQSSL